MVETVTAAQARRVALAAQGFGRARLPNPGIRQLNSLVDRLGLLQLDSVNVFERSHYLPVFARLGAYDKAQLDRLTFGPEARYTEYWAHVASIIPRASWPLWRWKMAQRRAEDEAKPQSWIHANRAMLDWLRTELADKGPLPASRVEHVANRSRGSWWGWSDVRLGLEYLFQWGEVVSAGRRNFERVYALPEQVLPAELLGQQVDEQQALRQLLSAAARAHGIGTVADIADYYRIKKLKAAPVLEQLAAEGELLSVRVPGWQGAGRPQPVYLHRDARIPRAMDAAALLSPFDPVVWERERALRMFGFHYRIEIYTPAPKRVYGYYTLPILIGDSLVGRIDLKSDRQNRVLRVQSAWNEAGAANGHEARIAVLLRETAAWQGLEAIEVMARGDLSSALAAELGLTVKRD